MKRLHDLFLWEVRSRIDKIQNYQKLINEYFTNIDYSEYSREIIDNENSVRIRHQLNLDSAEVHKYISTVTSPILTYYPPPAIGGFVTDIDLVDNIFNLQKYDIEPQSLIDVLDKALGIYQSELTPSLIRIFNPFVWLGKLLEIVASVPFLLLGSVGFDKKRLELSFVGKIVKLIIKLISLVVTIWEILYRLGIVPDKINIIALMY